MAASYSRYKRRTEALARMMVERSAPHCPLPLPILWQVMAGIAGIRASNYAVCIEPSPRLASQSPSIPQQIMVYYTYSGGGIYKGGQAIWTVPADSAAGLDLPELTSDLSGPDMHTLVRRALSGAWTLILGGCPCPACCGEDMRK